MHIVIISQPSQKFSSSNKVKFQSQNRNPLCKMQQHLIKLRTWISSHDIYQGFHHFKFKNLLQPLWVSLFKPQIVQSSFPNQHRSGYPYLLRLKPIITLQDVKETATQQNIKNQNLMKIIKPNMYNITKNMYNLTDPFIKDRTLRKTWISETGDRRADNYISHQFANKTTGNKNEKGTLRLTATVADSLRDDRASQ